MKVKVSFTDTGEGIYEHIIGWKVEGPCLLLYGEQDPVVIISIRNIFAVEFHRGEKYGPEQAKTETRKTP